MKLKMLTHHSNLYTHSSIILSEDEQMEVTNIAETRCKTQAVTMEYLLASLLVSAYSVFAYNLQLDEG